MTELDLDALELLHQQATPGPWLQATHVDEPRAICAARSMRSSLLGLDRDGMAILDDEADAALIVALRNAAPALLEKARRLDELESALGFLDHSGWAHGRAGKWSGMQAQHLLAAARELGWTPTSRSENG